MQTTERVNLTILDAFSSTGGMMGFIASIIAIVIGGLQEKLYFSALIKKLFLYTEYKDYKYI